MKFFSEVNRSTRIVWLCCLIFLLVTAAVLLYLMKSPIDPFDPNAVIVIRNEQEEQLIPLETEADQKSTTAPDELSEWSASVDGYTKFTGEYIPFTRGTSEETETTVSSVVTETATSATAAMTETTTETTPLTEPTSEYEHSESQTVTETVDTPPASETEEATLPPPTETNPPASE